MARLDRYEGYPQIYRRYTVDVILDDGTELPALIYEMTPKTKEIRNGFPYPEEYRKICREGANLHRIKNHFIRKKEAQSMKKETVLIAAYGTLRSGERNERFCRNAISRRSATIFQERSMTRDGGFPAFRPGR